MEDDWVLMMHYSELFRCCLRAMGSAVALCLSKVLSMAGEGRDQDHEEPSFADHVIVRNRLDPQALEWSWQGRKCMPEAQTFRDRLILTSVTVAPYRRS